MSLIVFAVIGLTPGTYYRISIIANIITSVLLAMPSVPPAYRVTFTSAYALVAIMACRVFRNLRFGERNHSAIFSSTGGGRSHVSEVQFTSIGPGAVGRMAYQRGLAVLDSIPAGHSDGLGGIKFKKLSWGGSTGTNSMLV